MSVILIIDSYYQYFFSINLLGFNYNGVRLSSLFGEESVLGSYLARLMPIIFGIFAFKKTKSKYFLAFTIILLILSDVIIFLSGERVAFFILTFSSLLIVVSIRNWFYVRLLSIIISLIIVTFIVSLDQSVKDRMITSTLEQSNILGDKMVAFTPAHNAHYLNALNIIKDNFIFGIGPKMFRETCNDEKYFVVDGCSTHPHNTYIQLLSETGVIGFSFVFTFFLFCSFIIIRQIYSKFIFRKSFKPDYYMCFIIAIFINLWPLMPTGNFFNNWISIIYYIPVGFILYFHYDYKQEI